MAVNDLLHRLYGVRICGVDVENHAAPSIGGYHRHVLVGCLSSTSQSHMAKYFQGHRRDLPGCRAKLGGNDGPAVFPRHVRSRLRTRHPVSTVVLLPPA